MQTQPKPRLRGLPQPLCYLCQTTGHLLHEGLTDRLFEAVEGTWSLQECPSCGLVWLDPMPLPEDLGLAYQQYYTHQSKDQSLITQLYLALNRLLKQQTGLDQEQKKLDLMYLTGQPGHVLDVGCGNGSYLQRMKGMGWQVTGVDFDAQAVARVREDYGIAVHLGDVSSAKFASETFDGVVMSHVIEHVPDPVALLQECYRILRPGGTVVVVTPNIQSWGHQQFGVNWRGLEPPRHLHLFSMATLAQSATQAGFPRVQTWTTAANANILGLASLKLQGVPKLKRVLQSLWFQYYEWQQMKQDKSLGEELVLQATKE